MTNQSFILGIEESNKWLRTYDKNDTIPIGDNKIYVKEMRARGMDHFVTLADMNGSDLVISSEKAVEHNGSYIKIWEITDWTWLYIGANVSVFSDFIDLGKSENISFEWSETYSYDPKLKSIFIPKNSSAYERLNGDNAVLNFSHLVPKTCEGCLHDGLLIDGYPITVNGSGWIVTQLTNDSVELGIEKEFAVLREGDMTETIHTGNKRWYVETHECKEFCDHVFINIRNENESFRMHSGQTKFIDKEYIHVWDSITRTFGAYSSTVSVLSKTVSINSTDGVLLWEDEKLSSVFIPEDSSAYEELMETEGSSEYYFHYHDMDFPAGTKEINVILKIFNESLDFIEDVELERYEAVTVIAPNNDKFDIELKNRGGGYTFGNKWANISIFDYRQNRTLNAIIDPRETLTSKNRILWHDTSSIFENLSEQ